MAYLANQGSVRYFGQDDFRYPTSSWFRDCSSCVGLFLAAEDFQFWQGFLQALQPFRRDLRSLNLHK